MKDINYPYIYQIEITERCNLKCPMCLNQRLEQKKDITLDLIELIIEKGYLQNTPYTELQMAGEPMLHPQIHKIVDMIKETGIYLGLSTNLTIIDMDLFNKLDIVTISLDIFDQKNYEKTRFPNKWIDFLDNLNFFLRNINRNVLVHIQILYSKWTDDFFADKERRLKEFLSRFDNRNVLTRCIDDCFVENRGEKLDGYELSNREMCLNPFSTVSIKADGTIVPCCFDFEKSLPMGNILEQDLQYIWNSSRYDKLRINHMKREEPRKCQKCYNRSPIRLIHSFLSDLIRFKNKGEVDDKINVCSNRAS